MRPFHPQPKILLMFAGLVAFGIGYFVWEFGFTHRLATIKLADHELRLTTDSHYDVSYCVLCELSGPKWRHSLENLAYIRSGDSPPRFTVHQTSNNQVYWITADTMPKTILYALNIQTGEHWPPRDSEKVGQEFLEIANSTGSGYRLYENEWIGAKRKP